MGIIGTWLPPFPDYDVTRALVEGYDPIAGTVTDDNLERYYNDHISSLINDAYYYLSDIHFSSSKEVSNKMIITLTVLVFANKDQRISNGTSNTNVLETLIFNITSNKSKEHMLGKLTLETSNTIDPNNVPTHTWEYGYFLANSEIRTLLVHRLHETVERFVRVTNREDVNMLNAVFDKDEWEKVFPNIPWPVSALTQIQDV